MGFAGLLCMCTIQSRDTPDQPLVQSMLPCIFWRLLRIRIDPSSLACNQPSRCRRRRRRAPRRRPRSRRPPRRRRRPRRRRPRRRSERGFTQPPGLDPHRRLSAPPSFDSLTLVSFRVLSSRDPSSLVSLAKADSTRRFSRAVPHRGTNRAFRCLTSEFKWDRVFSTKYGRQRTHWRGIACHAEPST